MGSAAPTQRLSSAFAASRARGLNERQQVAAVCYRCGPRGPEFLLVRTRGGRWIFPKGGVEPGLTHAQSAALEAFEEAGVHGRIEEMSFARYRHRKSSDDLSRFARLSKSKPVIAHLCEVSHLERPREKNRKPTWFSPDKAKKHLLEDRDPEFGDELAAVVDRAVSRIRRFENSIVESKKDELRQASLEPRAAGWFAGGGAAFMRYFLMQSRSTLPAGRAVERKTGIAPGQRKILPLETPGQFDRLPLRLTAGKQSKTDRR